MTPSSHEIECPIDLFDGCEREIERLTAAINRASVREEKGHLAREMLVSATKLLDCKAYDQDDANCRLCRDITTLRHKTAAVVDKATALSR
jgi:hypothetical protein